MSDDYSERNQMAVEFTVAIDGQGFLERAGVWEI